MLQTNVEHLLLNYCRRATNPLPYTNNFYWLGKLV